MNGSTSSDPDGTVASYAWDFGDGGTATGVTASHPFGSAGTYPVKLTVTDDKGATNSTTQQVTVTAPVDPAYAKDAFERTATNGWGTADLGGAWSVSGALPKWSVGSGVGSVSLAAGGSGTAILPSVSKTDTEVAVALASSKIATGGGDYFSVIARQVGATTDYRGKVQFRSDGTVVVVLTKMVAGTETAVSSTVVLPGVTMAANDKLQVRVQAVGTSPTTLRLKAWKNGTAEPAAWTLNVTDTTSGLAVRGCGGVLPVPVLDRDQRSCAVQPGRPLGGPEPSVAPPPGSGPDQRAGPATSTRRRPGSVMPRGGKAPDRS